MTLGEKIANLRKRKGWTQEYLAEKVGVTKTQVTRWETSRMKPSMPTLKKLAPILGATPESMLDGEEVAVAVELDQDLSTHFKRLQELEPDDRKVIFKIIDTFARQQHLTKVLSQNLD